MDFGGKIVGRPNRVQKARLGGVRCSEMARNGGPTEAAREKIGIASSTRPSLAART